MKNFINDKALIVTEAIDGVLAASGGTLERFSPDGHARVVLRRDRDPAKAALISGGGSGHEPAHAGFVGEGMLTAAVCGEVFASPSVDAVLAAILAATGEGGALLIVKNYTGDRLNFGLAAEKAKARGLNVEMVVVADDVALPDAVQPRGVAGTLFVHKIAGHLAESGADLATIARAARDAAGRMASLGLARDTCTVPGNEKHARVPDGEVEIGLGIHGEPGIETARFATIDAAMTEIAGRLEASLGSGRLAVIVNNLGGVSGLEMSNVAAAFARTGLAARTDLLIGPAALMTSLDMPGFSISCLELGPGEAEALAAPTGAVAWPGARPLVPVQVAAAPDTGGRPRPTPSADPAVRRIVETAAKAAVAMEAEINALDARVGDGDTGSTFAGAGRGVLATLDDLPFADGAALLEVLSDAKTRNMGGSSGVLLAIFFAAAADAFRDKPDWPAALGAGLSAMMRYGGAAPGDRTMIDALAPALARLTDGGGLAEAAEAAEAGAAATAGMTAARAGRSAYLNTETLSGVRDPGAEAISRIFAALTS